MPEAPFSGAALTDADLAPVLRSVIDAFSDPIFVKDRAHRFITVNRALCAMVGVAHEDLVGRTDADFFPREQVEVFWGIDDWVVRNGKIHEQEEDISSGAVARRILTRKFPLMDAKGEVTGLCGIITDVTDLRRREERASRIEAGLEEKESLIERQGSLLEQLAVPVIQIWEGILLLPLIGAIDERRAARILESLLPAIAQARAKFVLIDVTGVAAMDAAVAGYLGRTARASELLGCESIVVGIRPEIARTLAELDLFLGRHAPRATLQSGLEDALRRLQSRPGGATR
jgi:rsbT co-antagonist protein RsbR